MKKHFATYDDFFVFYVQQHSEPGTRWLHAVGTSLGLIILIGAFALGRPWFALLGFPVAYAFAWMSHFVIEKNQPATFGYPLWSFISDFRMFGLMLTGRLGPWLARAKNLPS